MIKYEIWSERCEFKTNSYESWSTDEIIDAYDQESWHEGERIFVSENLEDAKSFFENEKENCRSYKVRGNIWWLLETDVIYLQETEYDEDDEFVQANWMERYAEPLTEEGEEDEE